jgi:hypothetical protein
MGCAQPFVDALFDFDIGKGTRRGRGDLDDFGPIRIDVQGARAAVCEVLGARGLPDDVIVDLARFHTVEFGAELGEAAVPSCSEELDGCSSQQRRRGKLRRAFQFPPSPGQNLLCGSPGFCVEAQASRYGDGGGGGSATEERRSARAENWPRDPIGCGTVMERVGIVSGST